MNVGVYFSSEQSDGGVYQYSLSILDALWKIHGNNYVIFLASKELPKKFRKSKRFKIIDIQQSGKKIAFRVRNVIASTNPSIADPFFELAEKFGFFKTLRAFLYLLQRNIIKTIERENVDLVIYPASSNISFLTNKPSIVPIHDLQHRLKPRFKETSAWGRKQYRDFLYKNISNKAKIIIANSLVGKDDIVSTYDTDPEKIKILPYLPPSYLNPKISRKKLDEVKKKYNLPDKFFFYPAKFWPHKNHKNLIKGLSLLNKRKVNVGLVLTGSKEADFSTYDKVSLLADKLGIKDKIIYLGFIDGEDFSAIYKLSLALVMPTFFGPTNIPIYESWMMGVPVITSDLRGCREQVQDGSGLVVNPNSPKDISEKMMKILKDKSLRKRLIRKGKINASKWSEKTFTNKLREILIGFW